MLDAKINFFTPAFFAIFAKEIVSLSNVDGALIGGASLKADDFTKIIED